MGDRTQKMGLSIGLLILSVFFLTIIQGYRTPVAWDYGFLLDPYHLQSEVYLSPMSYIDTMHTQSVGYTIFVELIQLVTNSQHSWMAFPGILTIGLAAYTYMKPVRRTTRLITSFAVLTGPLSLLHVINSLHRDWIDVMMMFVLVIWFVIAAKAQISWWLQFVGWGIVTGLIYINHYTVFPFIAGIGATYLVLVGRPDLVSLAKRSLAGVVTILLPIFIYPAPFSVFSRYFPILRNFSLNHVLSIIFADYTRSVSAVTSSRGSSGVTSSPEAVSSSPPILTVPPIEPWWMPGAVYVFYALAFGSLMLYYLYLVFGDIADRGIREVLKTPNTYQTLLISVGISAIVSSAALAMVGYKLRILMFWPVCFVVLVTETDRLSQRQEVALPLPDTLPKTETIVAGLVLLVLVGNFVPMTNDYYGGEQKSALATSQQLSSAEFAEYASPSRIIYTDMVQANWMLLETDARRIAVGRVDHTSSGKVVPVSQTQPLYQPYRAPNSYKAVTTGGIRSVDVWGGVIPPVDPSCQHHLSNKIYTNGNASWYGQTFPDALRTCSE